MKQMYRTLKQKWGRFSNRARSLVLRGIATLTDAEEITRLEEQESFDVEAWTAKTYDRRHNRFVHIMEWIDYELEDLTHLIRDLGALALIWKPGVEAFLEGKLTMMQARFVSGRQFSRETVETFSHINHPKPLKPKVETPTKPLHVLAREALRDGVEQGLVHRETAKQLRLCGTDPKHILTYVSALRQGPLEPAHA